MLNTDIDDDGEHQGETMREYRTTLSDEALVEKAREWIKSLISTGARSWILPIPARPNEDVDLILSEVVSRFAKTTIPAESPQQTRSVGVDTTLSKLIDILGWQGGTIHDALSEVLTLVKFHENHHPTCKQSLQVDTATVLVKRLKWYIDEVASLVGRTGTHVADMKDADEYLDTMKKGE